MTFHNLRLYRLPDSFIFQMTLPNLLLVKTASPTPRNLQIHSTTPSTRSPVPVRCLCCSHLSQWRTFSRAGSSKRDINLQRCYCHIVETKINGVLLALPQASCFSSLERGRLRGIFRNVSFSMLIFLLWDVFFTFHYCMT